VYDKVCTILTALHRASYSENASFARFLIGKGANVNATSNEGRTALHSACHWNAFTCVRALVENGADVNMQTSGGPINYILRD